MKKIFLVFILFISILSACDTVKQSPEEEIKASLDKAVEYYEQENYTLSEMEFWRVLLLSEREYGEQSKEVAKLHLKTALYSTDFDAAIEHIQLAEVVFKKSDDMCGLAETYKMYGRSYDAEHNPELAQGAYEEALKYCDMGTEDMNDMKFHLYLLLSVLSNRTDEESLLYSAKAEKLVDRLPEAEKNEAKMKLYRNMGNSYYNLKKSEDAIVFYEKVIECWAQYGSKDQILVAECFDFCGYSYAMIGEFDKAVEYINQSLKLLEGLENARLWHFSIAYQHLSRVYAIEEIQNYEKSMEYGIKACKIYTEQQELSVKELEELISLKKAFKKLYEESPMAAQQEFESWYKENVKRQNPKK